MSSNLNQKMRKWPLYLILGLDLAALSVIWLFFDLMRQEMVLSSLLTQVIALVLVLVWFLFLSRLTRSVRLVGLGLVVLLGCLAFGLLEIREVSGDIVPILAWRWSPKPDLVLEKVQKTAAEGKVQDLQGEHDFPRFRGPRGDGTVTGVHLARDWSGTPPREVWRRKIGAGWSAFAVTGDLAVTQEQRGEDEMVTCYRLESGTLLWGHGDRARFSSAMAGDGPRATPTIAGNRVYTMGASGILNCLELETGRLVWSRNVTDDDKGKPPHWGYSCSPLVTGSLVVVSPGGAGGNSLTAYDRETGSFAWGGGDDRAAYSSPQLGELAGGLQILILNKNSVAGHDPQTGAVLWQQPWGTGNPNVPNPLVISPHRVFVSSGYGVGCKTYDIQPDGEGLKATELVASRGLKAKFANFVLFDDHVYGLDDGVLACLDPDTGERKWKRGRFGHGQLLLVGDLLLVQAEKGTLHLVDPNPESLEELGQIPILDGKAWNNLAISGNLLLMRNHRQAVCLALPTL